MMEIKTYLLILSKILLILIIFQAVDYLKQHQIKPIILQLQFGSQKCIKILLKFNSLENSIFRMLKVNIKIPKNTRICQFRIMENQPKIIFEEVEKLTAPDRGGIGSTGKQ